MTLPVLQINAPARTVHLSGYSIPLTRKEFDLLTLICQNSDRVVSRDEIFREVWGYDFIGGTKTLDMHIVTLRKKLGFDGRTSPIVTVRGIGFRLNREKIKVEFIGRHHGDGISWWPVGDKIVIKSGPSVITLDIDDLTEMINKIYEK